MAWSFPAASTKTRTIDWAICSNNPSLNFGKAQPTMTFDKRSSAPAPKSKCAEIALKAQKFGQVKERKNKRAKEWLIFLGYL